MWYSIPGMTNYKINERGHVKGPLSIQKKPKICIPKNSNINGFQPNKTYVHFSILLAAAYGLKKVDYDKNFVRFLDDNESNLEENNIVIEPVTNKKFTDKNGETWVPLWKSPIYQISDKGRIRRMVRSDKARQGIIVKQIADSDGYMHANVSRSGQKGVRVNVSRDMLVSFTGKNPANKEAAHEDGSKDNNVLSNLSWKTRKANQADRKRHGTHFEGETHPNSLLTNKQVAKIRKLKEEKGWKNSKIGELFGVSAWTIWSILHDVNYKAI